MVELYPFQAKGLEETKDLNRVAYYWEMGTGKTFMGSEKMKDLGAKKNLVVCQKSKIGDWVKHFIAYYDVKVCDLTYAKAMDFKEFINEDDGTYVGIINYDLIFRRPELSRLRNFTLMLDESSMIQNETAKRSKYILNRLHPKNVILLSGTPTGGKYEKLWSQCKLLGWDISKKDFWERYIDYYIWENEGWPIKIIRGYKNVGELKAKLREHGASFLKTEDVMDLPEQVFQTVKVKNIPEYNKFVKSSIVTLKEGTELVGDTAFNKRMYLRMLCGQYNKNKVEALRSLIQSNDDRMLIFYCFNGELDKIREVCEAEGRPLSVVNGYVKDLTNYENESNSITAIQYQAGSMGLNLQKSNKIVYFSPPDGMSELFEQSKKRTHRIGQKSTCFYYMLVCADSIEEEIYDTLDVRKERTDRLFFTRRR